MHEKKVPIIVVVSGYFTLLHVGHLRLFEEAKRLGDKLIVIVNNDEQLKRKKGSVLVTEENRAELIKGFRCVDEVVIAIDKNKTVCKTLKMIKPTIFANGGDRVTDNVPEVEVCNDLGIELVWNVGHGGKVDSSTRLLNEMKK